MEEWASQNSITAIFVEYRKSVSQPAIRAPYSVDVLLPREVFKGCESPILMTRA
jgi:hypothetical protein